MLSCSKHLLLSLLLTVAGRSTAQLPTLVQSLSDRVLPALDGHVEVLSCEVKEVIQILWKVNSTVIRKAVYGPFSFTNTEIIDNVTRTLRSNVSFSSMPSVNNTQITCVGFGDHYLTNDSSSAMLTIVGVPLRPSPRLDFHKLRVSWDAPFSWSIYPITSYRLSVQLSNGYYYSVVLDGNTLSHNFILNYSIGSCTNMTLSLTAQNGVGVSIPGTIFKSLPTAPGEFIEAPTTSITFSKEDLPHVQVTFTFPSLCKNNDATYFLRFYDEQGHDIYTNEKEIVPWVQGGMKTIIDIKNSVIKKDTIYQVILYVSTMGGNATATFNIDTTRGIRVATGTNAGLKPVSSNNIYIIVSVSGGFVILLAIIVIVIIIAVLYCRRKLKSRKRVCSENVLKTMITNPVYGNQVEVIYDEIPNSNNKYPQTLPQGLEESDEGYTSVRSTPVQVRTLPDIKPENQDPTGEDPYTVMNSIGTVLPRLSLTEDNTVDYAELSRTTSRNKRPENQYHFK